MCASWERKTLHNTELPQVGTPQAVQVATVMEHAPAAYRDLLKVVPLANRESYQALRAYVRGWTLAQRQTTSDTSAPMDRARKGKSRRNAKARKTTGEAKGNAWTDDSYFAGECGYCGKWGHKNAQCQKQKEDQGSKPSAATVQVVETVIEIQSGEDSFCIFAVSVSSGRNARILVDSGADEHVCPTDFAPATPGTGQGWACSMTYWNT